VTGKTGKDKSFALLGGSCGGGGPGDGEDEREWRGKGWGEEGGSAGGGGGGGGGTLRGKGGNPKHNPKRDLRRRSPHKRVLQVGTLLRTHKVPRDCVNERRYTPSKLEVICDAVGRQSTNPSMGKTKVVREKSLPLNVLTMRPHYRWTCSNDSTRDKDLDRFFLVARSTIPFPVLQSSRFSWVSTPDCFAPDRVWEERKFLRRSLSYYFFSTYAGGDLFFGHLLRF